MRKWSVLQRGGMLINLGIVPRFASHFKLNFLIYFFIYFTHVIFAYGMYISDFKTHVPRLHDRWTLIAHIYYKLLHYIAIEELFKILLNINLIRLEVLHNYFLGCHRCTLVLQALCLTELRYPPLGGFQSNIQGHKFLS